MILMMFFALLMMLLSLQMMISPAVFSAGIIKFSQQRYFHHFEILSRLLFGVIFIYYAPLTRAMITHSVFGLLMVFAGIFLLIIGAEKHRAFAVWSANKFCSSFRFFGVFAFIFAGYIIYTCI